MRLQRDAEARDTGPAALRPPADRARRRRSAACAMRSAGRPRARGPARRPAPARGRSGGAGTPRSALARRAHPPARRCNGHRPMRTQAPRGSPGCARPSARRSGKEAEGGKGRRGACDVADRRRAHRFAGHGTKCRSAVGRRACGIRAERDRPLIGTGSSLAYRPILAARMTRTLRWSPPDHLRPCGAPGRGGSAHATTASTSGRGSNRTGSVAGSPVSPAAASQARRASASRHVVGVE